MLLRLLSISATRLGGVPRGLPMAVPALPAMQPALRMMCTPSAGETSIVDQCQSKIEAGLEGVKEIKVNGAFDDPNGSHIAIYCVSEAFEGKRSLARQQMVFKILWEEMQVGGPVHAVDQMVLKAPSEV